MKILVGKNGINNKYTKNKRCKIFKHPKDDGIIILEFIRPLKEIEKNKTIDELHPLCLSAIVKNKFICINTFYSREAIEALGVAINEYLKHN